MDSYNFNDLEDHCIYTTMVIWKNPTPIQPTYRAFIVSEPGTHCPALFTILQKKSKYLKMPKICKTHGECRSSVCLICFKKGSSMTTITGVVLKRVLNYFLADFNPDNQYLPNGICSHCRNNLLKIDQGKLESTALPNLTNVSMLTFPPITDHQDVVQEQN